MKKISKKMTRGFTVTELLFGLWTLVCISGAIFLAYAAVHFIMKFW